MTGPLTERATVAMAHSTALQALQRSIRRQLVAGVAFFAILVFGIGGLAAAFNFAGAVVAQGHLVVAGNSKQVQHQNGGIVAFIAVHDGDKVKAGDLLLRLDPTVAQSNLAIIEKGMDELAARRARLESERDDNATITFPEELRRRSAEPEVAHLLAEESKLFELRRVARNGQRDQLRKRVEQLNEEVAGIEVQRAAKQHEIALAADHLAVLKGLLAKSLVSSDAVNTLERSAAQLDGELGQLVANAAQIGAEVAQTELQILQVDQDLRSEVASELSDISGKYAELVERQIAAADQMRRIEIRAPQDGTVYQLAVHTIGGVVNAGQTIMEIVPENDLLVVEAHIDPSQVDRLRPQLPATLRFSSLGRRTTPEIDGTVETISPDLVTDPKTGATYYVARISLPSDTARLLGETVLVPGMPVDVFVATGERTVLSYLVKPLVDQISHAFRER